MFIPLEGWYRYSCGLLGLPSHVWFSYATKGATYLVSNCEHNGVQSAIMRCVDEGMGGSLLRPLAFDGFVVDAVSEEWGQEVLKLKPGGALVEYVRPPPAGSLTLDTLPTPDDCSTGAPRPHHDDERDYRNDKRVTYSLLQPLNHQRRHG